jgi:hypothetical protein
MPAPKERPSGNNAAVGAFVLFLTLWFLWPVEEVLRALAIPAVPMPPRLWIAAIIAPSLLIAGAAYLRAPAMLWQVPLQALALACLFVGLRTLVLSARHSSMKSAGIGVGYLVTAALLSWLMRDLQRDYLRPHKSRKSPN